MNSTLYVGTNSEVAAIRQADGVEVWRQSLKRGFLSGSSFVTLLVDGDRVFAHAGGEVFCLDAQTGTILWVNELPGMGYDLASLAVEGRSAKMETIKERIRQDEASDSSSRGAD